MRAKSISDKGAPPGGERRRGRSESGFTLLEILVAVAILAVLVGIVPRSFVAARAMFSRSDNWLESRLVAETVLTQELSGKGLRAGVLKGTLSGREWTAVLQRSRVAAEGVETDRVLLDVRLRVKVSPIDILEVETTRIGAAS